MNQPTSLDPQEAIRQLRQTIAEATSLLENARKQLHAANHDKWLMTDVPLEVREAIDATDESIGKAIRRLNGTTAGKTAISGAPGSGPTRQQGQFLAFIHQYMMRNEGGVAPSHANLQRFFNLTAPSINSMLIRLEKRGFIRRIPGKARAIEITLAPDLIPPLDQPFKF